MISTLNGSGCASLTIEHIRNISVSEWMLSCSSKREMDPETQFIYFQCQRKDLTIFFKNWKDFFIKKPIPNRMSPAVTLRQLLRENFTATTSSFRTSKSTLNQNFRETILWQSDTPYRKNLSQHLRRMISRKLQKIFGFTGISHSLSEQAMGNTSLS